MNKEPLVSVIIPLYNAEDYILQTLESVAQQSYSNTEIVIIDNASTDKSSSIATQFCASRANASYHCTSVNSGGPAVPRNIGIEVSSGDYIAFLDSDDVWHRDKLMHQITLMESEGLNFTCTAPRYIDKNSKLIGKEKTSIKKTARCYGIKSLLFRNTITTSSVVIKQELLTNYCFNESAEFVTVEDYHLWMTLISLPQCQFKHLNHQLLDYRCMPASLGQREGKFRFLARSLLACSMLIVESKQYQLMPITLTSHLIRAILLKLKGLK